MVSVETVVASGSLGIEIDLEAIAHELSEVVDYDPEKHPGVYFCLNDSAPLITVTAWASTLSPGTAQRKKHLLPAQNFSSRLSWLLNALQDVHEPLRMPPIIVSQ